MATALGQLVTDGPHNQHTRVGEKTASAHDQDSDSSTFPSTNLRHSTVQELAKQISHSSTDAIDSERKPILGSNDPESPLNPSGNKFNARAWAQNIAKIAKQSGQDFRRTGLCFQNLNVFGYGTAADYQKDVANIWLALPGIIARRVFPGSSTSGHTRLDILHQFDGILRPGELCVVLGPPGSGCSTFLKTISGDRNGLYIGENSYFNYQGIPDKEMHAAHRGDAIYTAETDVHFPNLTVGETLSFASMARCQKELPQGVSRDQ